MLMSDIFEVGASTSTSDGRTACQRQWHQLEPQPLSFVVFLFVLCASRILKNNIKGKFNIYKTIRIGMGMLLGSDQ